MLVFWLLDCLCVVIRDEEVEVVRGVVMCLGYFSV